MKLNPSAAVLVPVDWLAYVERATATPAVVVAVEGGIGTEDAANSAAWPAGAGAECACISNERLLSCVRLFFQQESELRRETLAVCVPTDGVGVRHPEKTAYRFEPN